MFMTVSLKNKPLPLPLPLPYIYFIDMKQDFKKNAVHGRARAWKLKNKGKS